MWKTGTVQRGAIRKTGALSAVARKWECVLDLETMPGNCLGWSHLEYTPFTNTIPHRFPSPRGSIQPPTPTPFISHTALQLVRIRSNALCYGFCYTRGHYEKDDKGPAVWIHFFVPRIPRHNIHVCPDYNIRQWYTSGESNNCAKRGPYTSFECGPRGQTFWYGDKKLLLIIWVFRCDGRIKFSWRKSCIGARLLIFWNRFMCWGGCDRRIGQTCCGAMRYMGDDTIRQPQSVARFVSRYVRNVIANSVIDNCCVNWGWLRDNWGFREVLIDEKIFNVNNLNLN